MNTPLESFIELLEIFTVGVALILFWIITSDQDKNTNP